MFIEEDWVWENLLYISVENGFIEQAIDEIFWWFNFHLQDGKFDDCDGMLKNFSLSSLDKDTMIAVLSVTLAAKDSLKERDGFFTEVEKHLMKTDPERCDAILKGLRGTP